MEFIDWGLIDYNEATEKQLALVERVADGAPETIVFCRHPHVVTLGRGSEPSDLQGWAGATAETSRGGRATYHGPNQIIIYPILNLTKDHATFRARDLHDYMRALELAMIKALRGIGLVQASTEESEGDDLTKTGVWVGEKKIASIGIAVRKWISYHGCAINVEHDPLAFTGINPCGFSTSTMTSVQDVLGAPYRDWLTSELVKSFGAI
jgi:lipoyl(octanoyl) transferase